MEGKQLIALLLKIRQLTIGVLLMVVVLFSAVIYYQFDPSLSILNEKKSEPVLTLATDNDLIEDGIHVRTGLKDGEGLMLVVQNCTACHSAMMITQNRATKEGWKSMIKWMQQTQNLWDLGANEEIIINYLAASYPPQKKGRRAPLTEIDWYELK
jgi:hypothetical protein